MFILFLALQMAGMADHQTMDQARIDLQRSNEPMAEIPTQGHQMNITSEDLAASTIAFCKRTGKTYCENYVSPLSGGGKVTVCEIDAVWIINRCPTPK